MTIKVSQARKHGGSVALSLTGFVNEGDFYMIEKSDKQIVLTPIDVSTKE